jgi:hypothetical protein
MEKLLKYKVYKYVFCCTRSPFSTLGRQAGGGLPPLDFQTNFFLNIRTDTSNPWVRTRRMKRRTRRIKRMRRVK